MNTPENNNNPEVPNDNTENPSLLDQIIQTAKESNIPIEPNSNNSNITENTDSGINTPPLSPKKPRDPVTAGMVIKMIGSLMLVATIFFGSFLAYIVFNPEQAGFFVNIFGIDPKDVTKLLKSLINGSFGIIVLLLSIVWIITLFRAIWTPKEQKRKRLLGWLSASFVGILLFSILAFWAFLFKTISTEWDPLGGKVVIYDNSLYLNTQSRDISLVGTTNNLIGPITLRYDISRNANAIAKKNLLEMEGYKIDFDGANCVNGQSIMEGSNPRDEQGLICTFDEVRTYNIKGTYSVKNRLGESSTIPITLSAVEIKGNLEINTTTNKDKKKIITINAAKIKNLGNPRWVYSTDENNEKIQISITEEISNNPILICLKIFDSACDRYFIITDSEINSGTMEGSMIFTRDSTNVLGISMTLTGVNISNNEITNIDWVDNDNNHLCKGTSNTCEYTFTSYGKKNITATIVLANKKTYTVQGTISLNTRLLVTQHAKILNQDNELLNTDDTFDESLGMYTIKNIPIPSKLTFDARDIVIENSGYKMRDVTWRISHDNITEEKIGEQVIYELPKTVRYTIKAIYTFEKISNPDDENNFVAQDLIIVDLARASLEPKLIIQQSSDYTPAKITVDASTSQSKNSTIQKFIFDFGEGKKPAEGDAIKTYEYRTPGQKKITLTIIDNDNEQASISKYIVLKETPKNIGFTTSMSPGVINLPVDFISNESSGDIEEWIWNFGDKTPIAKGYEVTHTYAQSGEYNVTMTVRYIDGTEMSTNEVITVEDTLE